MTDLNSEPVCNACLEPASDDALDDSGLCTTCREHSRICAECGDLFDIASDGSEENPAICYGCEYYFFCPDCGVELCKPSDCPDGEKFGCSSCGGTFTRRGTEMVGDTMEDRVRDLETRLGAALELANARTNTTTPFAIACANTSREGVVLYFKDGKGPQNGIIPSLPCPGWEWREYVPRRLLSAAESRAELAEADTLELRARRAIDGWLAQFDGDDEVSYSVSEHPDTGVRKYAVFRLGNFATFTDQDWYPSPSALADALCPGWMEP